MKTHFYNSTKNKKNFPSKSLQPKMSSPNKARWIRVSQIDYSDLHSKYPDSDDVAHFLNNHFHDGFVYQFVGYDKYLCITSKNMMFFSFPSSSYTVFPISVDQFQLVNSNSFFIRTGQFLYEFDCIPGTFLSKFRFVSKRDEFEIYKDDVREVLIHIPTNHLEITDSYSFDRLVNPMEVIAKYYHSNFCLVTHNDKYNTDILVNGRRVFKVLKE